MKRLKYVQLYDGDWIQIAHKRGYRRRCCDCGLIHTYNYRLVKDKRGRLQIQVQAYRDKRATAGARRGKKMKGLRLP